MQTLPKILLFLLNIIIIANQNKRVEDWIMMRLMLCLLVMDLQKQVQRTIRASKVATLLFLEILPKTNVAEEKEKKEEEKEKEEELVKNAEREEDHAKRVEDRAERVENHAERVDVVKRDKKYFIRRQRNI